MPFITLFLLPSLYVAVEGKRSLGSLKVDVETSEGRVNA